MGGGHSVIHPLLPPCCIARCHYSRICQPSSLSLIVSNNRCAAAKYPSAHWWVGVGGWWDTDRAILVISNRGISNDHIPLNPSIHLVCTYAPGTQSRLGNIICETTSKTKRNRARLAILLSVRVNRPSAKTEISVTKDSRRLIHAWFVLGVQIETLASKFRHTPSQTSTVATLAIVL